MATSTDDPNASSDEDCLSELCGNIINNTFNINYSDVLTEEIAYTLNVYLTPVLVIMGIIGNLLSVIVFFKVKLQGQSTSQYLSALAISDTVFLLQLIPPWLKAVKASLVFARNGFCQMIAYLTYVSSSLSSWLVVAFTVERYVAILYPLRRTRLCTLRRARLLILSITFFCLAINIPVLIFVVPSGNDCNIGDDLMDHAARFNVLDTIFAFSLPLAVITVLNMRIMIEVYQQGRARGRLLSLEAKRQDERVGGSRRVRGRRARFARRSRPLSSLQQRITRILLIVSSVFVILNLPAYTMRIVAYANNMSSHEYTGKWAAIQQICLLFFNVNFGINFFLYCMTGQNFRNALCQTFPWLCHTWKTMNRLCCWRTNAENSPVRPAATRSFNTHTEATTAAAAACEEDLDVNIEWELDWHKRGADGLREDSLNSEYLEMDSFNNPYQQQQQQQQQQQDQRRLQPYPIHMYPFNSGQPYRQPRPRAPAMTMFRPIPYHLIPGQIAPLSLNSSTPTLSCNSSSSSSSYTLSTPHGCGGFGPALLIRPDNSLRMCPCKYENFKFKSGDIPPSCEGIMGMPKKRVIFFPINVQIPFGTPPCTQSQPRLVRSRSSSPKVYRLRRCFTEPASLCERECDATRNRSECTLQPVTLRTRSPPQPRRSAFARYRET